jgi:hypothetical protein
VALAYLEKREGQRQHPCYQAAGWPIGSGIVESANKLVMQARLKGAGMHWSEASVNPVLALRTAACSDRWEEAWGALRRHQQQRRAACRVARAQARLLAAMRALVAMWVRCRLPVVRSQTGGVSLSPVTVQPACADATRPARSPAADHPWRRPVVTHRSTA